MIYKQIRTGYFCQQFTLYKIKTMFGHEHKPVWNDENDLRVTKTGKWLRKYHIDEIPQLLNVLKRDMNLVGPRPERPYFDNLISKEVPHWYKRYLIRPGIMGLAQLRQGYTNTIDGARRKLKYDLFYMKKKSLKFDIWIIYQTLTQTIKG